MKASRLQLFRNRLLNGLAAVGLILFSGIAQANLLSEIEQRGTLRIAVPQDFPPFGSAGPDMKHQGYDIDVANYLANSLQLKLELIPVASADRIPSLQMGIVDLVISSLGKNAEREKAISFSHAYAPSFLAVFGPPEMSISSPADLDGRVIGVTRDAVEDIELKKVAPSSVTIRRYDDNNSTLSAYLSGHVPLIATGNLVATELAEHNPEQIPEVKFILLESPCYIGMKKGEFELQEKVNALIAKALADGSLNQASNTWFKAPLPEGFGS
ncbi:transporter substrate-binding domain-containing protein [Zobellella aerophila]|uniref:Transporter substrate-binding domain-containing protein n=1 Tax=Zobellella aerophila TaxID=870480 RepID=A0ABP6VP31_9GAMM